MKIVVLAGGLSPERDVSLTTGSLVAGALVSRGHEVCLCDLYTGEAVGGGKPCFTTHPIPTYRVGRAEPDLDALRRATGRGERRIGEGVPALCRAADVVFIGLHGDVGENGQLQAFLDMEGIAYTGSGYAGSLLAMDKDLSKQLLTRAGIPTPPWVRCQPDGSPDSIAQTVAQIAREIGIPCVLKPVACGSSVGVSMVDDPVGLQEAVEKAASYGQAILAERRVFGRELTVSVLGDRVLPPVEIIPKSGFYDYANKYQAGATEEICPARLSDQENRTLADMARRGFEALRLSGYARFDVILDAAGVPWCLEANTLPGMTPTSLLPQEAAAVGIDYPELCEMIIRLALKKKEYC